MPSLVIYLADIGKVTPTTACSDPCRSIASFTHKDFLSSPYYLYFGYDTRPRAYTLNKHIARVGKHTDGARVKKHKVQYPLLKK